MARGSRVIRESARPRPCLRGCLRRTWARCPARKPSRFVRGGPIGMAHGHVRSCTMEKIGPFPGRTSAPRIMKRFLTLTPKYAAAVLLGSAMLLGGLKLPPLFCAWAGAALIWSLIALLVRPPDYRSLGIFGLWTMGVLLS